MGYKSDIEIAQECDCLLYTSIPAFFKTNSLFASDVGIAINKDAHIIIAPNIGSYVGGDITAGTLVSMIWNRPEFSLFIDPVSYTHLACPVQTGSGIHYFRQEY